MNGEAIFRINRSPCDQNIPVCIYSFAIPTAATSYFWFLYFFSVTLITAHLVVVCLLDVSRICHSPNCYYDYCYCCCSNCQSACTTLRLCHTLDGLFTLEQRWCCICAHPKEVIAPLKTEEKKCPQMASKSSICRCNGARVCVHSNVECNDQHETTPKN